MAITRPSLMLVAAALLYSSTGEGARPFFEPTDLKMEAPGSFQADLQVGMVRGRGPWRVVVPDAELNLGLLRFLEGDLDGAYAIEGPPEGTFRLDHAAPDSLWLSLKAGLLAHHGEDGTAWAMGMQVGPKLPVARHARGVGAEALWLVGITVGQTQFVVNAGWFDDPYPSRAGHRPIAAEVGLDLEHELDQRFSLKGAVSWVEFLSHDPHQLATTFGPAWHPHPDLELSLVGLVGYFAGGDRYGLLLGAAPRIHLFD
jgi:hypothetical protein